MFEFQGSPDRMKALVALAEAVRDTPWSDHQDAHYYAPHGAHGWELSIYRERLAYTENDEIMAYNVGHRAILTAALKWSGRPVFEETRDIRRVGRITGTIHRGEGKERVLRWLEWAAEQIAVVPIREIRESVCAPGARRPDASATSP